MSTSSQTSRSTVVTTWRKSLKTSRTRNTNLLVELREKEIQVERHGSDEVDDVHWGAEKLEPIWGDDEAYRQLECEPSVAYRLDVEESRMGVRGPTIQHPCPAVGELRRGMRWNLERSLVWQSPSDRWLRLLLWLLLLLMKVVGDCDVGDWRYAETGMRLEAESTDWDEDEENRNDWEDLFIKRRNYW